MRPGIRKRPFPSMRRTASPDAVSEVVRAIFSIRLFRTSTLPAKVRAFVPSKISTSSIRMTESI